MKKISVLLICLLLFGCAYNSDIKGQLDRVYDSDAITKNRVNNYTNYIEYFVPSDINEAQSDALSFSFTGDGFGFAMNINASAIINKEYYDNYSLMDEGFFDEDKLVYSKSGTYINSAGKTISYFSKAYQYNDQCLLHFVSDELNFYGYSNLDKVGLMADKIMQMARACSIDKDKVIADYSSIEVIDYEKKAVNLFENIYPVEGRVEDLMVDKTPEVSE